MESMERPTANDPRDLQRKLQLNAIKYCKEILENEKAIRDASCKGNDEEG